MSSDIAERPPLTLTTGRWICRPCMQHKTRPKFIYSETGMNVCPVCGERSWVSEWDPEALAEAVKRRGEAW